MKKTILIIISVLLLSIALIVFIILSVYNSSNKFECKSDKGSITILYKNDKIVGYTAVGYSYDLDEQKEVAEKIGLDSYFEEFNKWFVEHSTNGNCKKK